MIFVLAYCIYKITTSLWGVEGVLLNGFVLNNTELDPTNVVGPSKQN